MVLFPSFILYWKLKKDKKCTRIYWFTFLPVRTNKSSQISFFHSDFNSFIFITLLKKWFIIHYEELKWCRKVQKWKGKIQTSQPETPTIDIRWTSVAIYSRTCGYVEVLLQTRIILRMLFLTWKHLILLECEEKKKSWNGREWAFQYTYTSGDLLNYAKSEKLLANKFFKVDMVMIF